MRYVVCGEALIDLVPAGPGTGQESPWRAVSGGGPMNTAVALARLGAPTEFMGRLGQDPFSDQLRSQLVSSGVGLDLAVNTDELTTLAVVGLDPAGVPSYYFHLSGTANFGWTFEEMATLTGDDWLHFGTLVTIVPPGDAALLKLVRSTQAAVSYDINVRPTVVPDPDRYWAMVEPFLDAVGSHAGIVKASDEDIRFLVGGDPDADMSEVAGAWAQTYGLSMVVVTLGADGAMAVRSDGRVDRAPGRTVTIADTVGAGDTFMAGFLTGYEADPSDVAGALRRGVAAASIVCSRHGANPPTAAEVDQLLAQG